MSSAAYLLAPGAWPSGGWWRHPEEWSSCLAQGCCLEERWPAASSPSWVLAAGGKLIFFFCSCFIDVECMIYSLSACAEATINLQIDAYLDFVLPNILRKKCLKLLNYMRCKFCGSPSNNLYLSSLCGSAFLCTYVFLKTMHSQASQPS